MNKTLLLGSANAKKAGELAHLLRRLPWQVKSLEEFAAVAPPEETGDTFEANAILKARYYGGHFGVACVADDSGLEVDVLGGAPGVFSALYAGEQGNDAANVAKLLQALEQEPWHARTARFVCCAAFCGVDATIRTEFGEVRGHIAIAPFGEQGFGYDPVFVPEGHDRTFGEMDADEKHALSHRGRAFAALSAWMETHV